MSQASAKADIITFELDALGLLPNGSQSVHSNLVRFSASGGGSILVIEDFGAMQVLGDRGLGVFGSNGVGLTMDFAIPVTSVSLWFGNDAPDSTVAGDMGILRVFLDGVFVGETTLLMNRDDFINQQISFSGAVFNRATFHFSEDRFLAETVDNVEFTPVPEPATVALMAIGIVGVVARIRRR